MQFPIVRGVVSSLRVVAVAHYAPWVFILALFPAFFAYHALIATGVMPPLLPGGGWSITNAVGALLLGPLAVAAAYGAMHWMRHVPFVLLAAWVAACAGLYFIAGAPWQRSPALLEESVKLICGWACLYAIGYLLRPDARFVTILASALFAMAVVSLLFIDAAPLNQPVAGGATYHWFANAVAFTGLICLALLPPKRQPIVLAVTLATLFVLGSRSEFVGFLAIAAAWGLATLWQRNLRSLLAGLALSALMVGAAYSAVGWLPLMSLTSTAPASGIATPELGARERQMEVLALDKSDSWQIRQQFQRDGWDAIKKAPVLGDYGGQLRDHGRVGAYIHNGLSAWRQFGLLPFLVYASLCVAPALLAAERIFLRGSDDPMWTLTLYFGALTLLLVIASKSVFWALPAFAWGLLAAQVEGSRDATAHRL